ADRCDLVVTMVGYPRDVEEVYLGERGLLSAEQPASLAIDFTTSSPDLARRIAEQALGRGVSVLDAPVSGGDVGARNGTLSVMVGGDPAEFERAAPVFEPLAKTVMHQGPAGSGQHTKMVNQTLIATNMIGVCEALLYARRAGLDPRRVLRSVATGAAGSWSLDNLAPRILDGDFAPGFFVEHFIKDMGIALSEAERMHLALPGLALAKQLYEAVRAQGHGRAGTQALWLALERLNSG
ncbi:MAG: NAD(P)-dependent oxidoreductase, partial [Planctomycetes bacterium]|nr:NAD(P)-dependent oxidoreductase [Planctomycetota bacterium]